jgi:DNA-binding CsgD family transcriptional regulator
MFEPRVRVRVRRRLGAMSLTELARRLDAASPGVRRPTTLAACAALMRDESLVDELCQDVALAFWKAIERGAVRAAVGVVDKWFTTATGFIVRRRARSAALLALVACPTDDGSSYVDVPTGPIVFGGTDGEFNDQKRPYRAALVNKPGLWMLLSEAELEVFEPWLDGAAATQIAANLGIKPGAVRLRLMRARQRLTPIFAEREAA